MCKCHGNLFMVREKSMFIRRNLNRKRTQRYSYPNYLFSERQFDVIASLSINKKSDNGYKLKKKRFLLS